MANGLLPPGFGLRFSGAEPASRRPSAAGVPARRWRRGVVGARRRADLDERSVSALAGVLVLHRDETALARHRGAPPDRRPSPASRSTPTGPDRPRGSRGRRRPRARARRPWRGRRKRSAGEASTSLRGPQGAEGAEPQRARCCRRPPPSGRARRRRAPTAGAPARGGLGLGPAHAAAADRVERQPAKKAPPSKSFCEAIAPGESAELEPGAVARPRRSPASRRGRPRPRLAPLRPIAGRRRWTRPSGWTKRALLLRVGLAGEDDVGVLAQRVGEHGVDRDDGVPPRRARASHRTRSGQRRAAGRRAAGRARAGRRRRAPAAIPAAPRPGSAPASRSPGPWPAAKPASRRPRPLVPSGISSRPGAVAAGEPEPRRRG